MAGGARATVPGFPREPQPPTAVYSEEFENGLGEAPILITTYTGPPPLLQKYAASGEYLKNCNGYVVEFKSGSRTTATDCEEPAYGNVRQMAWVLGKFQKAPNPETNHAVTAYTDGGTLKENAVQFETKTPVPLTTNHRFITVSVDAAETNCNRAHALLKFYLLNEAEQIPTFTSPVDPCTDPRATTIKAPPRNESPEKAFNVGAFPGNKAVLFSGSQLGVRMRNGQTSTVGNDAAFDNIRVLDATPQLDKSFSPAVLDVGQTSELTFVITNTTDLAAKDGWSFTDTLPSGLVVASPLAASTDCDSSTEPSPASIVASAGGSTIQVNGSLAAGAAYCTVTVDVTSSQPGTYTDGPNNITSKTGVNPPGPATVTFGENADLQIEKAAAPIPAIPGSDETYTLKVTNHGPDTARNVTVSDPLPDELMFVSASPGCQLTEATVTCQLSSLAAETSVTFTIVAHIASSVVNGFVNTAMVSSTTPDPDHSNNESTVETPTVREADLEVQKTPSLVSVSAGGQVTYTLVVKNNGPHNATDVTASDPLAPALSAVSAESSQGKCSIANGITCDLGAIAVGGSAQILVTANVDDSSGGAIANTATVAGGQTDPRPENNKAPATIEVTPLTPQPLPPLTPLPLPPGIPDPLPSLPVPDQPISDLQIVKHVNRASATLGQRLTYILKITNHGLDEAAGVRVTDTWRLGLRILSVHVAQGSCEVGHSVICKLGSVKANASTTITIVAQPKHTGSEVNTASVTSASRDPDLHDNLSSVTTDIGAAVRRRVVPPEFTG
jgi:uncharacterized repeat protein (TIGR01451 family)